jgi:hypothetical protein
MADDNEIESTEVVADKQQADLSIRETLKQQLNETNTKEEDNDNLSSEEEVAPVEDKPILAPPADMNASEKEAFLNPNPANAHILQSYLNRRAYETRADYGRKMQEVEQLRKETSGLYETIKRYENEYAKDGISIADVTSKAVAWDQAMSANPIEAAREWLETYGIRPEDLINQQYAPQQQAEYLTREQAESIAEERYRTFQEEQERKALEYINQQVVNSFVSSKPLFRDPETAAQLEAEMAPVVQALNATGRYASPEQVLETAYNYVVNGNPTFSSLVSKIAAGPAIQQQQATVQKAKAAARSISGSAGSGSPRIEAKNIRDNLQRRFAGD